jgi:hypothetical protein
MNKRITAIALMLLLSAPLFGQEGAGAEPLGDYLERQARIQRLGMLTLGGWAATNIAAGTALYFADEPRRDFHQMNVLWNSVNLGLAIPGYLSALEPARPETISEAIESQHNFEKVLLFNAGLDVAYMIAGVYMRELGRRPDTPDPRLEGWGGSIILQGAFLFAFDLVLYFVSSGNRDYRPFINETSPNRS